MDTIVNGRILLTPHLAPEDTDQPAEYQCVGALPQNLYQ